MKMIGMYAVTVGGLSQSGHVCCTPADEVGQN